MASVVALSSSQDEVAHVQIPFAHVLVVIASKLLLVSYGVQEGHVSSFLELVNCVLLGLLVCLFVVGLESR